MLKHIQLVIFTGLLMATAFQAKAVGGHTEGNGGDEVGLEFASAYAAATQDLQMRSSDLYKKLSSEDSLPKDLSGIKIVSVDSEIWVLVNGVMQNSLARNFSSPSTIEINRARWNKITDPVLREGIALHEVLGLTGKESSGFYPISGAFLAAHGSSSNALAGAISQAPAASSSSAQSQVLRYVCHPMQPMTEIFPVDQDQLKGIKEFRLQLGRNMFSAALDVEMYSAQQIINNEIHGGLPLQIEKSTENFTQGKSMGMMLELKPAKSNALNFAYVNLHLTEIDVVSAGPIPPGVYAGKITMVFLSTYPKDYHSNTGILRSDMDCRIVSTFE